MVSNKNSWIVLIILFLSVLPQTLFAVEADRFNRADSTSLNRFWNEETNSSASISSNILNINGTASASYWTNQVYVNETCTDCEVWVDIKRTASSVPQIHARAQGTNNDTLYACYYYSSGVYIARVDGDAVNDVLNSASIFTMDINKWYRLQFNISNNVSNNVELTCTVRHIGADGRNGAQITTISYTDSSVDKHTNAGVVALSTNGDNLSYYDNFLLINKDSNASQIVNSIQIDIFLPSRELWREFNGFNSIWNEYK